MSKAIAWPPKILDDEDYLPGATISSSAAQDLIESLNYSTAMIGMGQVIGQSWERDTLTVDAEAGQFLVQRWSNLPKIVTNAQKIQVYVKAYWAEDFVSPGDPTIIVRVRDEALNLISTDIQDVSNNTDAQWITFVELDVPEGDFFSLDLLVEGAVDGKIVFIESISASYVPLYEEDMLGNKTLVYEPTDDAFGALENADLNPYITTSDQPVSFAFSTERVAPDKPLSASLAQSIRATVQALISRERIYCLWQGMSHENALYGYMPAHYTIGAVPIWTFQDSVNALEVDNNWTERTTMSTIWVQYTEDLYSDEEDFDQYVYTPVHPLGVVGGDEGGGDPAQNAIFLDGPPLAESVTTYIILPDDQDEVYAYMTENLAKEPPWIGTAEEAGPQINRIGETFTTPEQELYYHFYRAQNELPKGNASLLRFTYLRHRRTVKIDGNQIVLIQDPKFALMPWGYIQKWYHKGV